MTDKPLPSLLIVDDDRDFAGDLELILSKRYRVLLAADAATALELVRSEALDVVLLDLDLGPGADGLTVLEELGRDETPPAAIVLTGDRDVDTVVRAVKLGAFHYVCKPPVLDELVMLIDRGLGESRRRRRLLVSEREIERLSGSGDFVAGDPLTLALLRDADRVAPTEASVLITGESGTGKEMIARRLHARSERAAGVFVGVNCACVPIHLIESTLMGHERGAFTGADKRKAGMFEIAAGGTIFLDEVGHSPLELQAKLLRVLAEKVFVRVGGTVELPADVRVIAATSRDPEKDIAGGKLLPELYFRLNVVPLHLAPLRERRGDILPLARHFLLDAALKYRRTVVGMTPAAERLLLEQDWPGNVRQLCNAVERAVVVSRAARLNRSDFLGMDGVHATESNLGYEEARTKALGDFKLRYVAGQLRRSEGNVTHAAEASGMLRQGFQRLVRELGLDPDDFRPENSPD